MKKCFVVCPIGKDGSETRKRSNTLLKYIITPVCEELEFEAIRVDNLNSSDSITETILNHLIESDLVIADITEHNPNAFYEIGYRSALGKPIIHLKSKDDSIPFDVSTIRTFDYNLQDLDSVDELKNRLAQTIKSFKFTQPKSNSNEDSQQNFNSQILQELFKIQDEIKSLKEDVNSKDTGTGAISILADKLTNTRAKSSEELFIETLLPTLLNNPDKITQLVENMNKFDNLSK